MRIPSTSLLLAEIAPLIGVQVELEPEFKFAGELIFPNGKRHVFRNCNLNINSAGSVEIAKDKQYTKFFLSKNDINVPNGKAFFSDFLNNRLSVEGRRGIDDARTFANQFGYPLYVKPNNLSQGLLVVKVYNENQLVEVASRILEITHVFLVEEPCVGRDYRVVVLGDSVISAYERIPLEIIGDGVSSATELLEKAKLNLSKIGRPNSEIDITDFRIDIKLASESLDRNSIISNGKKVPLLDNANLSTGGNSIDVTNVIHSQFIEIAVKASRVLGLRFAGIDIICSDICKSPLQQKWNVIEVNGAPGLDNYASLGEEQANRVKNLYKNIIEFLAYE